MIEINLLPKELQHRRFGFKPDKKLINLIAGGLVVALILMAYSYFFQINTLGNLDKEIATYEQQRQQYTAEIQKIEDMELKKEQIIARKSAIMVLDQNRDYWVKLMEDLARRVPDYVWVTGLEQGKTTVKPVTTPGEQGQPPPRPVQAKSKIQGYSFSLNALATFLVRMKKSEIFNDVEIVSIKLQETEEAKAYYFEFSCNLVAPELKATATEMTQTSTGQGTQF